MFRSDLHYVYVKVMLSAHSVVCRADHERKRKTDFPSRAVIKGWPFGYLNKFVILQYSFFLGYPVWIFSV